MQIHTKLPAIPEEAPQPINLTTYWNKLEEDLKRFDAKDAKQAASNEDDETAFQSQLNVLKLMLAKGRESNGINWPSTYRQLATQMNQLAYDEFGSDEIPDVVGSKSYQFAKMVYLRHMQRFATVEFNAVEKGVAKFIGLDTDVRKKEAATQAIAFGKALDKFPTLSANPSTLLKNFYIRKLHLLKKRLAAIELFAHATDNVDSKNVDAEEAGPAFFAMSNALSTHFKKIPTLLAIFDMDKRYKEIGIAIFHAPLSDESRALVLANKDTKNPFAILKQSFEIEKKLLPGIQNAIGLYSRKLDLLLAKQSAEVSKQPGTPGGSKLFDVPVAIPSAITASMSGQGQQMKK